MVKRRGGSVLASVACAIVLPVTVGGCAQLSEMDAAQVQPQPAVAAAATADPVVLSGVAYAPDGLATSAVQNAVSPSPANSAIVGAPAALVETIPVPPRSPVIAGAPAAAPPVNAVEDDGFPAAVSHCEPFHASIGGSWPSCRTHPCSDGRRTFEWLLVWSRSLPSLSGI